MINKFQFVDQCCHNTFGRFYPHLYTVWSLFRKKKTTLKTGFSFCRDPLHRIRKQNTAQVNYNSKFGGGVPRTLRVLQGLSSSTAFGFFLGDRLNLREQT